MPSQTLVKAEEKTRFFDAWLRIGEAFSETLTEQIITERLLLVSQEGEPGRHWPTERTLETHLIANSTVLLPTKLIGDAE